MIMATYNILDFGARIGDLLVTDAIQKAIDTCFLNGGGEVVIPAGFFRTGDLRIRSNVTLHLLSGAMLEGSEDFQDYFHFHDDTLEPLPSRDLPNSYPGSKWNHGLIKGYQAKNIAIIGEPYSYIDGRNVYDPTGEEQYRGPHGINLWECENVTLKGYTLRNTGNWAHAIYYSKNIEISDITVYGGHDGIDIFLCDDVRIFGCTLLTGDDSLAGYGSKNVHMHDCVMSSSCSALRFGGTDVLLERCTTHAPGAFGFRYSLSTEAKKSGFAADETCRRNMHTAFLYYCDSRYGDLPYRPGNILIRDCDFQNPDAVFEMDFGIKWCNNEPLRSITFENCRFSGINKPILVRTEQERPLSICLRNVTIAAQNQTLFFDGQNCERVVLENVTLEGYTNPHMVINADCAVESTGSTPFTIETL